MSLASIVNAIVERHAELKRIPAYQFRAVKSAIAEAVTLSQQQVLTLKQTDRFFKSIVPDSGKPSAALRAYRKRANLTQRELSKKSSIPQPHIAAMEGGKRPIGLISAKKLARALRVDYKRLL